MPQCVRCYKWFHPDWCFEQNIRGDDVVVCTFCRLDKQELTVESDDGIVTEIVTKDQANRDYLKYLDDLSKKPSIAKILASDK